jgi:hypothetical protein
MTRRRGTEVWKVAEKIRETRWRYLLRNPEFQKDLHARRQWDGDSYLPDLQSKWNLDDIFEWGEAWRLQDCTLPDLRPETVEQYEALFQSFRTRPPVESSDPAYSFDGDYDYVLPGHQPGRFLDLRVDLHYPLDVLMPLIEDELHLAKYSDLID